MLGATSVDWRNPQRRTPVLRNLVFLYGHRPQEHKEIWYLSAYEFMVYWTVGLADYSRQPGYDHDEFPAVLTERGFKKVCNKQECCTPHLLGGEDYVVKHQDAEKHHTWLPLPDNAFTR